GGCPRPVGAACTAATLLRSSTASLSSTMSSQTQRTACVEAKRRDGGICNCALEPRLLCLPQLEQLGLTLGRHAGKLALRQRFELGCGTRLAPRERFSRRHIERPER